MSMTRIVGAGLSQFHNDEDNFELLLAYSDGREVGFTVSRSVVWKMAVEFAEETGLMDALNDIAAADGCPPGHVAYLSEKQMADLARRKIADATGIPS